MIMLGLRYIDGISADVRVVSLQCDETLARINFFKIFFMKSSLLL